ncbi:rod shape-determining protein RodA [Candidatus Methylacidiphilum fumarolicum]|uniref:Rod shape-determining protein rodA n=2 Tax=Candidatus Methylacidiphilum fumarolicum TaxID=591154 RepID=I0JXP1_METFB|nr:rod shape-determining protein RodA [Candidatus Methylacidiphilum fumarolicum]MBW6415383.1 rod shape-determining protein RodA [Candidatus Methylacidiphilum fumarolicum]TFE72794.1 rod shape-determining protein RodA [Candidatus Methylacidiphilum fumarolicum]TFE74669.1 rod shape-determining protein RodA [Candidatus Methylacidiphilum fumarolicum]CAI9086335.1 Rod shape-determining protein RodA [Candidatus Methylacidiphilum fumarolicum]CCG92010.1 Rod shape-determining protein rodA [Methylacidiphil
MENTSYNNENSLKKKEKEFGFFDKFFKFDWFLFLIVLALSFFGIAVIYSATYSSPSAEFRNAPFSQFLWLMLGLVIFFIVSFTDYHFLVKWSWILLLLTIPLLVLVLLIGQTVNGAKSWLRFGPIGIEPAELCKLAFILFGSFWLDRFKHRPTISFLTLCFVVLIPFVLILKQPALGSAGVFIPILFAQLFIGGLKKRYLAIPLILILAVLLYAYIGVSHLGWDIPGLKPYQMNRIRTFFDPNLDPLGSGWTINQSLIAIGSGSFSGKGFLKGTQNMLGFLPKNIAYNDFIFSVIGEEWGFIGGSAVIIGEGIMLLLCLRAAFYAKDLVGSLVAGGVAAMLFTHIFVNIGMTIKVVPITGIPLPFISYGGTFLIICLIGLGLVESIWIRRNLK